MFIPFTQFIPPNARQRECSVETHSSEVESQAKAIMDAGGRFTVEVLGTGVVSLACEACLVDEEGVDDIAIELSNNGPDIQAAAERMINTAYNEMKNAGKVPVK